MGSRIHGPPTSPAARSASSAEPNSSSSQVPIVDLNDASRDPSRINDQLQRDTHRLDGRVGHVVAKMEVIDDDMHALPPGEGWWWRRPDATGFLIASRGGDPGWRIATGAIPWSP